MTQPTAHGGLPAQNTSRHSRQASAGAMAIGFVALCVSYMINAMDRQVFYPLLPEIREEFGFSLDQSGLLATGFTLGLALTGLPAGYLLDRLSRRMIVVVSVVVYSLGTIAIPLSAGFADMALYRLLSGVGEGVQATAIYAIIGAYF
jgi:MFS family permease